MGLGRPGTLETSLIFTVYIRVLNSTLGRDVPQWVRTVAIFSLYEVCTKQKIKLMSVEELERATNVSRTYQI